MVPLLPESDAALQDDTGSREGGADVLHLHDQDELQQVRPRSAAGRRRLTASLAQRRMRAQWLIRIRPCSVTIG